jgi:hypothetical protein
MNTQIEKLKEKRQYYHKLLLALGEAQFKDVIISSQFGVESTTELTEAQLDSLIFDARKRLNNLRKPTTESVVKPNEATIKRLRNKCLLVLNERGITATPKDWSPINNELAKKQYQWILTPEQEAQGLINKKGLYAFNTEVSLKKLFNQLSAIRDAEKKKAEKMKEITQNN